MNWSRHYLLFGFILSLSIVAILFAVLYQFVEESTFLADFFLRAWYVQAPSTWLFLIGLWKWWQCYCYVAEARDLIPLVKLRDSISSEDTIILLEKVPAKLRDSITVRRLFRILEANKYREDFIRLNEELSRRDSTNLERSHETLNSLKSVIPVVGFLGTVIGLSLGMLNFPDIPDVEALRIALKQFAQSLSIAFNTTLLALVYTIILILLTAMLKENERRLLEKLDNISNQLVTSILAANDGSKLSNQKIEYILK